MAPHTESAIHMPSVVPATSRLLMQYRPFAFFLECDAALRAQEDDPAYGIAFVADSSSPWLASHREEVEKPALVSARKAQTSWCHDRTRPHQRSAGQRQDTGRNGRLGVIGNWARFAGPPAISYAARIHARPRDLREGLNLPVNVRPERTRPAYCSP